MAGYRGWCVDAERFPPPPTSNSALLAPRPVDTASRLANGSVAASRSRRWRTAFAARERPAQPTDLRGRAKQAVIYSTGRY